MAATATLTTVGDATTSTTLFASNANRVGAKLVNLSDATLYLKEGSSAGLTSFSEIVPPYATWKLDCSNSSDIYTGIITGIWTSDAGGSAYCTERTV